MNLIISNTVEELSIKAAEKAKNVIESAISKKGCATVMVATGMSHMKFYEALLKQEIDWSKIDIFHLDEYIGISENHKASFRKYIKENIEANINAKSVTYINGNNDPDNEISRLNSLVKNKQFDLGIVGIGENGHIAFNDPPADFETDSSYLIVDLDDACKKQQVGEGWFESLEEVPQKAITASPKFIISINTILSVVPYEEKAEAVKKTLEYDGITNKIPATFLKSHKDWYLYLDSQSSSKINNK